jgi:hypothetical protein
MQLGIGFWGSKTLLSAMLSAIELGVFTELAKDRRAANRCEPTWTCTGAAQGISWMLSYRLECYNVTTAIMPTLPKAICSSIGPSRAMSLGQTRQGCRCGWLSDSRFRQFGQQNG